MEALRPTLAPLAKDAKAKKRLSDLGRPKTASGSATSSLTKTRSMGILRDPSKVDSLPRRQDQLQHSVTNIQCDHYNRLDSIESSSSSEASEGGAAPETDPTLDRTKRTLVDARGKPIVGVRFNKGAMTHLKFTSVETPASGIHPKDDRPVVTKHGFRDIRCGFCHANNMQWHLQCAFCGSCRVSEIPRMNYIVNMILSVDPKVTATKMAQQLLQYAKFDAVAVDAEKRFKQATLVRSKAAMVLMTRSSDRLRWHIVRMIFLAWKKVRAEAMRGEETMARLIKIKEMQGQGRLKAQVFSNWKNLTTVKWDERINKLSIAADRKTQMSKRYLFSRWMRFVMGRLRKKCSYLKEIMMSNQEFLTARPPEEFDHTTALVHDLKEALVASVDQSIATSEALTMHLKDGIQEIVHIQTMLPSTAGYLLGVTNLAPIVNGFVQGEIDDLESCNLARNDHGFTQTALDAIGDRVGRFIPWDTLLQWLNAQITYMHTRLQHRVFPAYTNLQDIQASSTTPKFILHLLWHLCPPSKADFDAHYADECAKDPLLALSPHSATNRNVQWKIFLAVARDRVFLPPELASREDLMGGHFDAYYSILTYFFATFAAANEPSSVQAGQFPFLQTWPALKDSIAVTQAYDTDASLREACREIIRRLRTLQASQVKLLGIHRQLAHVLEMHQHAVLRGVMGDFCRRVGGRETTVAIALEREELAPNVRLDYARLASLCSIDEFALIENVYQDHVVSLVHIFRSCGGSNGGKSMGEHEFYKLMSQCGLIERKNMTRAYLQLIVQASSVQGVDPTADRFGDMELSSTEFVEAITRVAYHMHEKRPAVALVDLVKEVVEMRLLPVAQSIDKQGIGSFKRQLRQPDVQSVLRSHDKKLKRLFAFHASEKRGKFMTLAEFEGWLKEQRLVDGQFPHHRIKTLFFAVQQDTATSSGDGEGDPELIFAEFVEAVAAVAVFRNPNPYASLAGRLESFLNDNL
ncbi:Aste57867_17256 [Aphanomyces stellatus]|uniref:Aste57867_17256 protein n=1 Tax=Aphanomyces stellatus TaxID=120398 RepID=A0A485L7F4_9STRA|nr:hypothetical protein As57867_017197 [Aphanomyces stellatus]VFT94012.1 Aste57867_17256 [Aphanomyces stellatus]